MQEGEEGKQSEINFKSDIVNLSSLTGLLAIALRERTCTFTMTRESINKYL